ncbi:hypothetical protein PBR20603_01519 [Pandoraea bronchicola]|uniref:Uncharacterized protein n=1 Tax=Pandoraea bronchicola TaxID=2508287 RepID=A0A5E5BT11_9BURK|nr:hypothetical protein PBR20603_01519 [Pandoraea bronchicola]
MLRIQTTNRFVIHRKHPKHQIEGVCWLTRLVGAKNRFDQLARGVTSAA